MQFVDWRASSQRSLRGCSRGVRDAARGGTGDVQVMQAGQGADAYRYAAGLYHCGSRQCARCSSMVTMVRYRQLAEGLNWFLDAADNTAGGESHEAAFATFTMQHSPADSADMLMDALGKARAALTKGAAWNGGTRSTGDRQRFGVCGMVSTLEVTWSPRHGYHFHLHCLLLLRNRLGTSDYFTLGLRMHNRWRKSLLSSGLDASLRGFTMLPVADASDAASRVASYMSKSNAENAARELTLSPGKLGRGESVSFFELLAILCQHPGMDRFFFPLHAGQTVEWDDTGMMVIDQASGEVAWSSPMRGIMRYWRIIHTLERVLKGRRQHTYSKRRTQPKSRLDELWNGFLDHTQADQSDEELANTARSVGSLIQTIPADDWFHSYVANPANIIKTLFPTNNEQPQR